MKTRRIVFGGIEADLPADWVDMSDQIPERGPFTFAKSGDGVGALQFSVAHYVAGVRPAPRVSDLGSMLDDFAAQRELGRPISRGEGQGRLPTVWADYKVGGDLVRVWYLSAEGNFVLATYVAASTAGSPVVDEMRTAQHIVESLRLESA